MNEAAQLQLALDKGRKDIVFFAYHFLGLKLHPGQIRFLRGADGIVNVLVPANRWGKTVMIAVRHLWYNFYKIGVADSSGDEWSKLGYRTACIAPDSKILAVDFRTIVEILESRFKISPDGEPIVTNQCRIGWYLESKVQGPPPRIVFKDNSSIEFYSTSDDKGTKLQGDFYGYASYDEGGRSHHLYLELNQNIGQRLSQMGAPLDLVSTPAQDSPSLAYHFEIFNKGKRGEGGYKSFEGSAYENLYLPKHYFEREETRLAGDPLYDQVLHGKFVFGGNTLFPADDIDAAKDPSLNPGIPYEDGHTYVIGVDTAMGEDEMVFTVLDTTTEPIRMVKQVACKGNSKSPQLHMDDFINLVEEYRHGQNIRIILETWNGESGRFYQDMPQHFRFFTRCWGSFQPQGTMPAVATRMKRIQKEEILISLRKLLYSRGLKLPNEQRLVDQLSRYREDDKNLPTDRVMSLALACWLATDGKPKTPTMQVINIEPF